MGRQSLIGVGSMQGPKTFISAIGGVVTTDGNYKVHTFTGTNFFRVFPKPCRIN